MPKRDEYKTFQKAEHTSEWQRSKFSLYADYILSICILNEADSVTVS